MVREKMAGISKFVTVGIAWFVEIYCADMGVYE